MTNQSMKKDFAIALVLVLAGMILFTAWLGYGLIGNQRASQNLSLLNVGETAPPLNAEALLICK